MISSRTSKKPDKLRVERKTDIIFVAKHVLFIMTITGILFKKGFERFERFEGFERFERFERFEGA